MDIVYIYSMDATIHFSTNGDTWEPIVCEPMDASFHMSRRAVTVSEKVGNYIKFVDKNGCEYSFEIAEDDFYNTLEVGQAYEIQI